MLDTFRAGRALVIHADGVAVQELDLFRSAAGKKTQERYKIAQDIWKILVDEQDHQIDLAVDANVSAKHLCFLETGRSQPSREMVQLLGSALDPVYPQIEGIAPATLPAFIATIMSVPTWPILPVSSTWRRSAPRAGRSARSRESRSPGLRRQLR